MILVAGKDAATDPTPQSDGVAQRLLRPTLADYRLRVERSPRGYFNVTSDRMLLEPAAAEAVLKSLDGLRVQPALTYLANTIACGDREIPVLHDHGHRLRRHVGRRAALGPFRSPDGKPIGRSATDEIVLNSWAADDLQAKPGDTIRVDYFEPESTHGQVPRANGRRSAWRPSSSWPARPTIATSRPRCPA